MNIGLFSMQRDSSVDTDRLLKRADNAMYKSKKIFGHTITLADD
jgi:GGDEF domain-containing protein